MVVLLISLFITVLIGLSFGVFNPSKYVTRKPYTEQDSLMGRCKPEEIGDPNPNRDIRLNFKQIAKAIGLVFLFIFITATLPLGIQRIDAGSVGLKIDRIGNDKGIPVAQPVKGWVFYNTWIKDVLEYSIRQQHIAYSKFAVPTKGGVSMDVAPSFNYALKPEKAADVYIHLLKGGNFEDLKDTWIATATNIALKNATNEFTIDSIFNNQAQYQKAVEKELNKEMSLYFTVTQINPGQITPPAMANILNAKAQSIQEAQKADLTKITAQAQAQADIAKARGDSASAVIQAAGEAEAIKLKTREISQTYVDYIKWLNAGQEVPRVPATILGSGASVLLSR